MRILRQFALGGGALWAALLLTTVVLAEPTTIASDAVAAKPLFRDPVYDGAADPVVIWNPAVQRWWMFYTNRRANAADLPGVTWVHGTRIGIAESEDRGATWSYLRTADIELPPEFGGEKTTHWAPDIVRADDGTWRMFLTVVPGIFAKWEGSRHIVQLTSRDLVQWRKARRLPLASARAIDAGVLRLPDGTWRLWYNDELDGKAIHYAESRDMEEWTDRGPAAGVGKRCEGPKVFRWNNSYWLVADEWKGLAVYRSDDALTWTRQAGENLLAVPGTGADDQVKGGHADVVVSGERAWLFYFTHPGRRGAEEKKDGTEQRRSSIQVVELELQQGRIVCDRDRPTRIALP
ncbi:MAG: family 43 glycosylhydrolase [Opitutae bacterium]|nr:family 43 glycosylhydrolase [Opitutae bacterium]